MAALALCLYLLWAPLAFGLRAVLQKRRTGDTGFRGFHGQPGSAEWWGGVLFVGSLSIAAVVLAPVADLTGLLDPIGGLDAPALRAGARVLAGLGVLANLAAQLAMATPGESESTLASAPRWSPGRSSSFATSSSPPC